MKSNWQEKRMAEKMLKLFLYYQSICVDENIIGTSVSQYNDAITPKPKKIICTSLPRKNQKGRRERQKRIKALTPSQLYVSQTKVNGKHAQKKFQER